MQIYTDTIAAISTAMNNSGIGIIRISGPDAFLVIRRIFVPMRAKDMAKVPTHSVHYGNIVDGDNIIDEVLVLIMKGPHTYTREDTVEIDCHGGIFVMNKILELVFKNGARCAEPGEFTKRAFLNGRIDLAQAEAVTDIINSENEFALRSAEGQLKGSVSRAITGLREKILEQTAYIEAALDDPEHIELDNYGEKLIPVIEAVISDIDELLKGADDGRIIKEGIRTVILGKPNVGKSSLLNALLGEERAIVTDIAGTTRDVLEEAVRLGDITLNIIDTAGIRETDNIIEKIGVDKAREYAEGADLLVFVVDASRELDKDDWELAEFIKNKKAIALINKQDLEIKADLENFKKTLSCPTIDISVKKNIGLDNFVKTVREMFYTGKINFNDQIYITNARHKEALINAESSLMRTKESIELGMSEEFFTIDMMDAYTYLGSVIGQSVEDDLADEIFSKFCMGK